MRQLRLSDQGNECMLQESTFSEVGICQRKMPRRHDVCGDDCKPVRITQQEEVSDVGTSQRCEESKQQAKLCKLLLDK